MGDSFLMTDNRHTTFEIHHPTSGRCIGYLTAEESDTAGMMQRSGYIVIQQTI
jgi:hypothetical protein